MEKSRKTARVRMVVRILHFLYLWSGLLGFPGFSFNQKSVELWRRQQHHFPSFRFVIPVAAFAGLPRGQSHMLRPFVDGPTHSAFLLRPCQFKSHIRNGKREKRREGGKAPCSCFPSRREHRSNQIYDTCRMTRPWARA